MALEREVRIALSSITQVYLTIVKREVCSTLGHVYWLVGLASRCNLVVVDCSIRFIANSRLFLRLIFIKIGALKQLLACLITVLEFKYYI